MSDPFLKRDAIEVATRRFDALTEEVERITGLTAGVDHTGGGCLAYVAVTPFGSVAATVGYADGSTEPDVPETEEGPWFAAFYPLDSWLSGSVGLFESGPLDRAGLLAYIESHSNEVQR